MKAAIFKELGTPLVMGEVPKPEVNANEILMKVKAAAICIADIYSIKGERPLKLPHIMGHEAAGIVADVGSAVRKFKPGDRILGNAIVTCNQCYYCKRDLEQVCENHKIIGTDAGTQGAFAEYYKLPAENIYLLPEEIPFDQATVITSPLASAYHGVRVADIQKGDTVVVYGGGAIGYHAMLGALTYDDVRVFMVDTVDEKLELAKKADLVEALLAEFQADVRRVLDPPTGDDTTIDDFWAFLHLLLEVLTAYRFLLRDMETLVSTYPKVGHALKGFSKGLTAIMQLYIEALRRNDFLQVEDNEVAVMSRSLVVIVLFSERFDEISGAASSVDVSALRIARSVLGILLPHSSHEAALLVAELAERYREHK